jgi:polar amino acid transport system substrate-binding protein
MSIVPTYIAEDLAPAGALRASINLGNRLLVQGTPAAPTGVTVDIARDLGERAGVPVELVRVHSVPKTLEAMRAGQTDICFMAVDPEREAEIAFTSPYAVVEGVFVVPLDSPIATVADVDREHVRIGVVKDSSHEGFLSRTLKHATVVRGDRGVDVFRDRGLEVAAGVRQIMTEYVASNPGLRLIEGRFMQVRQAVGTTRTRAPQTQQFLQSVIEELKASGFIADAIRRANQLDLSVAQPGSRR